MPQAADVFRKIALSMPQAAERAHMGHPDFRVNGKIFATLFSRDGMEWGMVKLKPDQQRQFVKNQPKIFQPIKGGWGRQGCTQVCLDDISPISLREAIFTAWCNTAPGGVLEQTRPNPKKSNSRRRKPRAKKSVTVRKAAKNVPGKRK